MKPFKENSIHDQLLQCNSNLSFNKFLVLAHGNKTYLLEIKESPLIKRDHPVLSKKLLLYICSERFNEIGLFLL